MGTNKVRVSEISKSMVALIEAVGVPTLPKKEELSEDGWFTAVEYAEAIRRSDKVARKLLRNNSNIDKRFALFRNGIVEMFKPKTKTRK